MTLGSSLKHAIKLHLSEDLMSLPCHVTGKHVYHDKYTATFQKVGEPMP